MPAGVNRDRGFIRPSGTCGFNGHRVPSVDTLGYSHVLLRGKGCRSRIDSLFGASEKERIAFFEGFGWLGASVTPVTPGCTFASPGAIWAAPPWGVVAAAREWCQLERARWLEFV
jgi:hypothetical protein